MRTNISSKWATLNNAQRITISLFLLLLTLSSAVAIWLVAINGSTTFVVTADEPLTITQNFNGLINIDATDETTIGSDMITFNNNDGLLIDVLINATETRTDVDDDCSDYETDVAMVYQLDDVEVSLPLITNITAGTHNLTLTATAQRFSCPQNVSIDVVIDGT